MVAAAVMPGLAKAELPRALERWQISDPLSKRTVDHGLWAELLARYLAEVEPGVTRFDYGAVTEADRAALDRYLETLSQTDIDRLNRDEQLAFWLNAYNALLVRAVLYAFPVKSPNDAGGGLFSSGPWESKIFKVYEISLSLRDIGDRIVRARWPGGLSVYGLACAAKGCPNLPAKPFRGNGVAAALKSNAEDFVNRGPGILNIQGAAVKLSSFYQWYRDDFGASEAAVLQELKERAEGATRRALVPVDGISGHGFDWSLNQPDGR